MPDTTLVPYAAMVVAISVYCLAVVTIWCVASYWAGRRRFPTQRRRQR